MNRITRPHFYTANPIQQGWDFVDSEGDKGWHTFRWSIEADAGYYFPEAILMQQILENE